MAGSALPIGGKVVVKPVGESAVTFDGDDNVFATAVFRKTGVDVAVTVQNGLINRVRQSFNDEVRFETYSNDAGQFQHRKKNVSVKCYEDNGTTLVANEVFGSIRATFNESSETTSFVISGKEDVTSGMSAAVPSTTT